MFQSLAMSPLLEEWAISISVLGKLHRHCYTCFTLLCAREGDACQVVSCSEGCGACYHACKGSDHLELCPRVSVPCLNVHFGCDLVMRRSERAAHLPSCPASTLACGHEWNRWPVNCTERSKHVPFRQRNPKAKSGQLDYELAVRDQRVVAGLQLVPRPTKLALRNHLTRRFPALPLPREVCQAGELPKAVRREVVDCERINQVNYGIVKVFQRNQEIQRVRWQEDVDVAIQRTGQPVPKKYWQFPEMEKGNICSHCAYCYNAKCNKTYSFNGEEFEAERSCSLMECSWGCGATYHVCKGFEHQMICPTLEGEGEYDWVHRHPGEEREQYAKRVLQRKLAKPAWAGKEKKVTPLEFVKQRPDLLALPCHIPQKKMDSRKSRVRKPPPPPTPDNLYTKMGLDIKMEMMTRLHQKPRAMYTLLCGAEVRRDQWEGHCRNVHSEIHGGLNNWLEARCPLASYGCGFSWQRLYPGGDPRTRIVFSQDLQSFGVRPPPSGVKNGGASLVGLLDLPEELLLQVLSLLDPWSLASVALVSRRLRHTASSFLDCRGCLALQWSQVEGVGWRVANTRWFFPPYFEPVKQWGHRSDGPLLEHLRTCPYNMRTEHRGQDQATPEARRVMVQLEQRIKLRQHSQGGVK